MICDADGYCAREWGDDLINLLWWLGLGADEEAGDDVADAGRDRQ